MTVGRMLMMSYLDFCFQGEVFEGLLALPIDILSIDAECLRNGSFVAGLTYYLDFF